MAILSDEFYYQPIRIDTINTRVYADIIAKEGDANGRGLLLTLTENGLMKDTTGITLILKWEHTSVGNQGLDNFEVVDLSKGLYKITYPTEMLNRGKIRAFIQIIDSGKLTGTRNIEITVDRGVGDDTAIASSDSFTALTQALIDVNNIESTYAPRMLSVEQQLAETYVNVKAYGAKGDGVTDDYIAIRDALIACGNRTLYFPKGIYLISQTLIIPAFGTTLKGDGAYASIIRPFGSFTGSFLFDVNKEWVTFRDLQLDCDTKRSSVGGIDGTTLQEGFDLSHWLTIDNCLIFNCNVGLSVSWSNHVGVKYTKFKYCNICISAKDRSDQMLIEHVSFFECLAEQGSTVILDITSADSVELSDVRSEYNNVPFFNFTQGAYGFKNLLFNNVWLEHNIPGYGTFEKLIAPMMLVNLIDTEIESKISIKNSYFVGYGEYFLDLNVDQLTIEDSAFVHLDEKVPKVKLNKTYKAVLKNNSGTYKNSIRLADTVIFEGGIKVDNDQKTTSIDADADIYYRDSSFKDSSKTAFVVYGSDVSTTFAHVSDDGHLDANCIKITTSGAFDFRLYDFALEMPYVVGYKAYFSFWAKADKNNESPTSFIVKLINFGFKEYSFTLTEDWKKYIIEYDVVPVGGYTDPTAIYFLEFFSTKDFPVTFYIDDINSYYTTGDRLLLPTVVNTGNSNGTKVRKGENISEHYLYGKLRTYMSAIPTYGTYEVGDIAYNPTPTAGGYLGWVCVTAGTPGTWRGFGLIQA